MFHWISQYFVIWWDTSQWWFKDGAILDSRVKRLKQNSKTVTISIALFDLSHILLKSWKTTKNASQSTGTWSYSGSFALWRLSISWWNFQFSSQLNPHWFYTEPDSKTLRMHQWMFDINTSAFIQQPSLERPAYAWRNKKKTDTGAYILELSLKPLASEIWMLKSLMVQLPLSMSSTDTNRLDGWSWSTSLQKHMWPWKKMSGA